MPKGLTTGCNCIALLEHWHRYTQIMHDALVYLLMHRSSYIRVHGKFKIQAAIRVKI